MLNLLSKELGIVLGGAALIVGGIVMAKKAKKKTDEIMKKRQSDIEIIEACIEDMPEEYSETDKQSDMLIVNSQTTVNLFKAWAPSVLFVGVGLFGIICTFIKTIIKKNRKGGLAHE